MENLICRSWVDGKGRLNLTKWLWWLLVATPKRP